MKSTSLLGSTLQLTAVSLLSQLLYFLYQVALSRMVGTEVLGLIHMVMPVYYTFLSLSLIHIFSLLQPDEKAGILDAVGNG